MALNNSALDVAGNALAADITHLSLHSADPGAGGANETTAARQPAGWTVTNGDLVATNRNFTGGTPNGPVTHVGYWTAASGGTFRGSQPLSGDTTFNAEGEYTVTNVTEDASAS